MTIRQKIRGKKDKLVLGIFLGALLATGAFLATSLLVMRGHTRPFDEWVLKQLRNPNDLSDPIGSVHVEEAVRDITAIGGTTVLALMTILASCWFFFKRQRFNGLALSGGFIGALILNNLLKGLFARSRPELIEHHLLSYSFPSGHTLLSTSVYLILGAIVAKASASWRSQTYAICVGMLLAFLVGASRVYLAVHYPTDVLGGWCIGLAWAITWWHAIRKFESRWGNAPGDQSNVAE